MFEGLLAHNPCSVYDNLRLIVLSCLTASLVTGYIERAFG